MRSVFCCSTPLFTLIKSLFYAPLFPCRSCINNGCCGNWELNWNGDVYLFLFPCSVRVDDYFTGKSLNDHTLIFWALSDGSSIGMLCWNCDGSRTGQLLDSSSLGMLCWNCNGSCTGQLLDGGRICMFHRNCDVWLALVAFQFLKCSFDTQIAKVVLALVAAVINPRCALVEPCATAQATIGFFEIVAGPPTVLMSHAHQWMAVGTCDFAAQRTR